MIFISMKFCVIIEFSLTFHAYVGHGKSALNRATSLVEAVRACLTEMSQGDEVRWYGWVQPDYDCRESLNQEKRKP